LGEILALLPKLISDLDITEKDFDQIQNACEPYLSERQHAELQHSCIDFMFKLLEFNAAALYVKLQEYRIDKHSHLHLMYTSL
jgi:hypothetical protein